MAGGAGNSDQSCPDQNKRRGAEDSSANGELESDEGRDDRVESVSSAADQPRHIYRQAHKERVNSFEGAVRTDAAAGRGVRALSGESLSFI
jgi:hypothetical protein